MLCGVSSQWFCWHLPTLHGKSSSRWIDVLSAVRARRCYCMDASPLEVYLSFTSTRASLDPVRPPLATDGQFLKNLVAFSWNHEAPSCYCFLLMSFLVFCLYQPMRCYHTQSKSHKGNNSLLTWYTFLATPIYDCTAVCSFEIIKKCTLNHLTITQMHVKKT